MSDRDRSLEILEEFADAQGLGGRGYLLQESLYSTGPVGEAYRDRQVRRGECIRCRRPAEHGRRSCFVHLKESTISATRSYRRRRAERIAADLCVYCGLMPRGFGHRSCHDCRQRVNQYNYQRYSPYAKREAA